MGIASLILGIVSIVIGFIPLCGAIAIFPAIVGIILGIVEIVLKTKKGEKKTMGIVGLILSVVAVIFIVFWIFVLGNSTENNNVANSVTNNVTNNVANEKTKSSYKIGESFKNNNIKIIFLSVDQDFKGYNKYSKVKEGYKVIKATFEFENIGTTDKLASSFDFNCYADNSSCDKFYGVDDSFSSTLSLSKKASGNVYFEVPIEAQKITIEYSVNTWTSENIEFIVK